MQLAEPSESPWHMARILLTVIYDGKFTLESDQLSPVLRCREPPTGPQGITRYPIAVAGYNAPEGQGVA